MQIRKSDIKVLLLSYNGHNQSFVCPSFYKFMLILLHSVYSTSFEDEASFPFFLFSLTTLSNSGAISVGRCISVVPFPADKFYSTDF